MSFVSLIQWFVLFVLAAAVVGLWVRALRAPKDDPRLSKGLQILQSKISILEDLSDRTDLQVKQLTHLIEKKTVELQEQLNLTEQSLSRLQAAIQKSKEMSQALRVELTQEGAIERKNMSKYIQAAQLAHQGHSSTEIGARLGLSPAEVDFVIKVNKDQLVFCETSLPAWVESSPAAGDSGFDNESTFIKKIAEQRNAQISPLSTVAANLPPEPQKSAPAASSRPSLSSAVAASQAQVTNATEAVRPYLFKKMDMV